MMRKATDRENRELRRRKVVISVAVLSVVAALWFVVMVVGPVFPQNIRGWVVVPSVWVILGLWGLVLWGNFRCPVCQKWLKPNTADRCRECGTQFER